MKVIYKIRQHKKGHKEITDAKAGDNQADKQKTIKVREILLMEWGAN